MPDLPARPNLDQLRHQAKDLLHAAQRGDPGAAGRITAGNAINPGNLGIRLLGMRHQLRMQPSCMVAGSLVSRYRHHARLGRRRRNRPADGGQRETGPLTRHHARAID